MHKLSTALKTRYIKAWCPQCKYICRVSRKNLANGAPICPVHIVPMKVQRYKGSSAVTGPDTSVVDKFLVDMRADREAQMVQFKTKWALEAAARKRTEELSIAEEKRQKAAQAEEWAKRNNFVPPVFPEPVWQVEARRRQEADEAERRWKAEYQAQQEQQHREWEARYDEHWAQVIEKVKTMAPAQPEPQPEPAPQPRRTFGRAAIHAKWEENRSALTALRKPRVQQRLIKTDIADPDQDEPETPTLSSPVAPGRAAEDADWVLFIEEKSQIEREQ